MRLPVPPGLEVIAVSLTMDRGTIYPQGSQPRLLDMNNGKICLSDTDPLNEGSSIGLSFYPRDMERRQRSTHQDQRRFAPIPDRFTGMPGPLQPEYASGIVQSNHAMGAYSRLMPNSRASAARFSPALGCLASERRPRSGSSNIRLSSCI